MATPLVLIVGPLFIAALLTHFLFGLYVAQLYYYFNNYGKTDKKPIVYVVLAVTFIEILNIFFASHACFVLLSSRFGHPELLHDDPWTATSLPTLNGFGALLVQLFFAWRVYSLAQTNLGKALAIPIVLLALTGAGSALAVTIEFALAGSQYTNFATIVKTAKTWLACSFSCDLIISVEMAIHLYNHKSYTAYRSSKRVIDTLIITTIENAAVTTACSLAHLVSFSRWGDNWVHMVFEFMGGRLYANVLIATLNARSRVRGTGSTIRNMDGGTTISVSTTQITVADDDSMKFGSNKPSKESKPSAAESFGI